VCVGVCVCVCEFVLDTTQVTHQLIVGLSLLKSCTLK